MFASLPCAPGTRAARLTELVHRAIPYPVLLVARQGDSTFPQMRLKPYFQQQRRMSYPPLSSMPTTFSVARLPFALIIVLSPR